MRSILLVLACSVCLSAANENSYKWNLVIPAGSGRFPDKWEDGKWPMGIIPIIAYNGNLYMIGQKFTWISNNGIHWKAYPKTDWGERHGMSFSFFKGKLWMMGGMESWDKFCNDIWSSDDGFKWERVTAKAEWSERRNHCVIVHNNIMFLYGGAISSGRPDQTSRQSLNDIWSSKDGEKWIKVVEHAAWSARDPEIVKFKNKFVMVGGPEKSDVWLSEDAIKWSLISNKTPWKNRLNFGLQFFDGKLWFFGGREHNDVWSTNDGKTWIKQSTPTPWSTRTAKHSIVFSNKLWIYSGKTGREDSWSGEVWTLSK